MRRFVKVACLPRHRGHLAVTEFLKYCLSGFLKNLALRLERLDLQVRYEKVITRLFENLNG